MGIADRHADISLKIEPARTTQAICITAPIAGLTIAVALLRSNDEFFDAPRLNRGVGFWRQGCEVQKEERSIMGQSILPYSYAVAGVPSLPANVLGWALATVVIVIIDSLGFILEGESQDIGWLPKLAHIANVKSDH